MVLVPVSSGWIIPILIGCLTILVNSSFGQQSFTVEPEDVTVRHGEAVTLPCRVSNKVGYVQWTKDGFGLGVDAELPGFTRYEMLVNEEQGVYDLHIQPVLVEDNSEYQCQVSGDSVENYLLSNIASLTVHFPPQDSEDRVYLDKASPMLATAGSPVRITCHAGLSAPASTISWLLNGEPNIPSSKVNTTNHAQSGSILVSTNSRLDLTPSRSHHEANITCQVSHPALEEPITRSLLMTVKYPPEVTVNVDSAQIKEGDEVLFTCEATGNPSAMRYRWEVNDIGVIGDHSITYLVRNIGRDMNSARVACIVANAIGTTKAEHTISVEYSPKFKEDPGDVDEDEGKEVTLSCDVDGNPPAQIVWLHNNQNKVIQVGASHTLTISPDTIGTYECRATVTGFPEKKRTMEVFMRSSPEVVPGNEQYGLEGDTVQVVCDIKSIPRPSQVIWSKEKHMINPNESHYSLLQETTRNGVRSTLIIYDAQAGDFGAYNCTAKNGYGSHTYEIQLKRQQSLPLVTTLVAIIGGILFLIVVIVVILLFKKKGKGYKEPGMEKHSMRSSDRSSIQDSVLKVETRTTNESDLSPSDEDDYSSHDDWETSDTGTSNARRHDHLRYSAGEFGDSMYPSKEGVNNNSGGYVQYTDYTRDYNPPPAPYNRNSGYNGGQQPYNNIDPRYSAAYGNPYLKVPSNARSATNIHGMTNNSTAADGRSTPLPGNSVGTNYSTGAQNLNNTLNNINNNAAGYGQVGNTRNNLRSSTNMNNQYIMVPQGDARHTVQGTHI